MSAIYFKEFLNLRWSFQTKKTFQVNSTVLRRKVKYLGLVLSRYLVHAG